jgi:electron transport complex protein RnfA
MGSAVTVVMALASCMTSIISNYLLKFTINGQEVDLGFLRVLTFILVIAALVQLLEVMLQKVSPVLYRALGIYLPLITTNCAVLGAATINAESGRSVLDATIFGACSGVGFALALVLFSSIREKLELADPPKAFEGTPIALVTAGILAMAFAGFAGLC